jgi:hypothetical protein
VLFTELNTIEVYPEVTVPGNIDNACHRKMKLPQARSLPGNHFLLDCRSGLPLVDISNPPVEIGNKKIGQGNGSSLQGATDIHFPFFYISFGGISIFGNLRSLNGRSVISQNVDTISDSLTLFVLRDPI